ncbi:MAG: EAL domain-containing protein [Pseudomonadota bacterium]
MSAATAILYQTLGLIHGGVLLLDENRRVEFVNRWLCDHSGKEPSLWIGKTLCEIFPESELGRIARAIRDALEHAQSSVLSHLLQPTILPLYGNPKIPTCEPIIQSFVTRPLKGELGHAKCLVQISDITSAYKREQMQRKQSRELADLAALHKANDAQARAIIENIGDALITLDAGDNVESMNTAARKMFYAQGRDIVGSKFSDLCQSVPESVAQSSETSVDWEGMGVRVDGSEFVGEFNRTRIPLDESGRALVIARDITYQKKFEETLFREKEFAQVTLQSIADAVITTDENTRVNSANPAAQQLLAKTEDELLGCELMACLPFDHICRKEATRVIKKVLETGESQPLCDAAELVIAGEQRIPVDSNVAALRSRDGNIIGTVTILRDTSEARRMQEMLTYQATHDDLTKLINRREFDRRLGDMLIRANCDGGISTLIYMDLDQFKIVNDTCGHIAGDLLLQQVSGLLQTHIRATDSLARLGGDEFAILLPGCNERVALRIAETVRNAVNDHRFSWEGRSFAIGASIGLVNIDANWQRVDQIMSAADAACYISKENGRNRVTVYQQQGEEEQHRHGEMMWASRIRGSLEKNRFMLYCQPIVPVNRDPDARFSIEILVRMLDDNGDMVAPMAFIPAAERYDLMTHIDRWVVEHSAEYLNGLGSQLEHLDKCAINLSAQSIGNEEFFEFITQVIESYRIPWTSLCFEVTETAAMTNIDNAQRFINELVQKGCRFSLDDFGSGLSSFAYLKQLRVDYVKIDGAFVRNMLEDDIDAAMVRSISDVARSMNLKTIAEFVENDQILEKLAEAQVTYAQGYGICRPFPLNELEHYFKQWEAGRFKKIA